ncbi:hypothetical protein ABB37_04711 [Leptomonas pyrrhocoris]|uniref:Uncharacterized protein n=1 Tax=Leptomonas pyrrhocoris TaxID=157538 RepID=A0A0N0VF85_LEPPY|nr:hypothetical protein ABB37_04711 [Leptomonas pyrrhocoris]KPA80494.1 hypothetical protein ABB37_04711 [Leptomonas pyrrhocoris]|eukprot:XP_015658933.1 hypothetical protein ABB37_04711 [Leptomonas pyrrhocoris]
MIAANGQPAALSMSTPVSANISPAQMSLDPGTAQLLGASMMPANLAPGMSFSVVQNGPSNASTATAAAATTPMLQATTDANGNTTYVYVNAPITNSAPTGPRMLTPPAAGTYFVQTPSGIQAFSAPVQAAQMPTYYAPKQATTTANATPGAASLQPQGQPYFPSMTVPPMFVDAQGNPVTPMQQNIIMPNYYPSFTPQQLLASQQPPQQPQYPQQFMVQPQQPQQPQQAPMQRRSSLPSFAEASGAAASLPMMVTPTNAPFARMSSAPISNASERSPATQQLPQPSHPDITSTHFVSPQLSSTASNTNFVATAGSSAIVTPMDGGMAVPTNTLRPAYDPPRTVVPLAAVSLGVSTGASGVVVEDGEEEHPLFNYDSLGMNDGNNSLTSASSMTATNDMPVTAVHLGIEEDEVSETGSEAAAISRFQAGKH